MKEEKLFRAIGEVGSDLIDMAEKRTFAPSRWRKWGALAACLAVVVCLAALALPYFPMGCGSSTSSSMDTAAYDSAALVESTVTTAETAEAVEEVPMAEDFDAAEAPEEPLQTREQLVFQNMIYYVEALYSQEEGEAVLGAYLGVVEDADQADWIGCAVYGYRIHDEMEDAVPIDLLVQVTDGYLYCVTYRLQAGAPFHMTDTMNLLEQGQYQTVLDQYAAAFEAAGFTFDDPSELTVDQLTGFFLLTLQTEREAGLRTEDLDKYLWYDEENDCYVVPAADVTRQLDRYLAGYSWDPEQAVLIFESLTLPEENMDLRLSAWTFDSDILTLTVENGNHRSVYTIQFTEDACWYRSIVPVE